MGRTLRIETPRAFRPLLQPARYKGAWGGRGGAKSWFFAGQLVSRFVREPETRWACIREVQKSLDQSVKRLIEDTIERFDVGHLFRVLSTHIETGQSGRIIFQGMQNHTANSIKSLERYNGAWVEEAHSLSKRSLQMLTPTFRVEDSELWFSWNPDKPDDPVDDFFRGNGPRKPGQPAWQLNPDAVVTRVLYRDNPWFPEVLADEVAWDKARDPDKYAHVWLGEYARNSEARVFHNWRVEHFETPERPVPTFYYGADWGFATDPSVLVRCYIQGRTLYIDREVYRVGCEIDATPALFDQLDGGQARRWDITADSARPETISYMQRHGYPRIRSARKGPGSVEEGVEFLKSYDIIVHPRCIHVADEFALYSYKTDKLTDKVLPVLEDRKNHTIDAVRYAIEAVRKGTKFGYAELVGY